MSNCYLHVDILSGDSHFLVMHLLVYDDDITDNSWRIFLMGLFKTALVHMGPPSYGCFVGKIRCPFSDKPPVFGLEFRSVVNRW